jgi:hypothetical protein
LDWNRYSYARYNPLKYTDPSGHEVCLEDGYCGKYFSKDHLKYLTRKYGVIFKNDWTEDVMWAIVEGVQAVGQKFSEGMGVDAAVAFRQVYGIEGNDKFIFESGCPASECSAFGRTYGSRHVKFRDFYKSNFRNVTLAVHELAHAFENVLEITLPDGKKYKPARESLPDNLFSSRDGLADEPAWTWQHSEDINRGEIFADMFVGWVFDKWANPLVSDLAGERAEWMSKNMPTFYK